MRAPNPARALIGLIPWLLFSVIANHSTLRAGALAALVIAMVLCAYEAQRGGRPKLIEVAAVITFAIVGIVAFLADASLTDFLTRYARAIAAGALSLFVFGSLLFDPFTAPYARERVPEEFWDTPEFRAINRRLTLMWGGIFAVLSASHVVAGAIDTGAANVVFNWVIPIILIVQGINRSRPDGDGPVPPQFSAGGGDAAVPERSPQPL